MTFVLNLVQFVSFQVYNLLILLRLYILSDLFNDLKRYRFYDTVYCISLQSNSSALTHLSFFSGWQQDTCKKGILFDITVSDPFVLVGV